MELAATGGVQWSVIPVAVAAGLLFSCPPAAQASSFWSFLPAGTVVQRCTTAQDRDAAAAALRAVDQRIHRLGENEDAAPIVSSLKDLLRTPCFRPAVENGEPNLPSHPTALKAWWADGGRDWLSSYLHEPDGWTVLPPDPRRVLYLETPHEARVAPLLCSQADVDCGGETGGWRERAARASPSTWMGQDQPSPREQCEGKATGREAYTAFRDCVGAIDQRQHALPLGRTRAPRDGWLVISGRRGHDEFCDGLAAYDLATGAAYRAESCSGLQLLRDGSVDHRATDARRQIRAQYGRVPLDNLREAAWMMVLEGEAERVHVRARRVEVPHAISIRYKVGSQDVWGQSGHGYWSTAWTRLHWSWIRPDGGVQAEGELTWPTSGEALEAHAASLLDVAEQGLARSCPPGPLLSQQSAITRWLQQPGRGVDVLEMQLWRRLADLVAAECTP